MTLRDCSPSYDHTTRTNSANQPTIRCPQSGRRRHGGVGRTSIPSLVGCRAVRDTSLEVGSSSLVLVRRFLVKRSQSLLVCANERKHPIYRLGQMNEISRPVIETYLVARSLAFPEFYHTCQHTHERFQLTKFA